MNTRYLGLEGFRAAAKAGTGAQDCAVSMTISEAIKAINDEERSIDFIISTGDVDRHGDRVNPDGWDFKNFRTNPVVLWGHDYDSLPLAKARDVRVEDGSLKATAVFTPAGMARFNDTVYEMLKGGFLNAVSVGFLPKKWSFVDNDDRGFGIDFQEQELLEFSVTPVPALPQALIDARGKGLDIEPYTAWLRDAAEKAGLAVIDPARLRELEAIERKLPIVETRAATPKFPRLTSRALDFARTARAV